MINEEVLIKMENVNRWGEKIELEDLSKKEKKIAAIVTRFDGYVDIGGEEVEFRKPFILKSSKDARDLLWVLQLDYAISLNNTLEALDNFIKKNIK
jgi:hypothetical protein